MYECASVSVSSSMCPSVWVCVHVYVSACACPYVCMSALRGRRAAAPLKAGTKWSLIKPRRGEPRSRGIRGLHQRPESKKWCLTTAFEHDSEVSVCAASGPVSLSLPSLRSPGQHCRSLLLLVTSLPNYVTTPCYVTPLAFDVTVPIRSVTAPAY